MSDEKCPVCLTDRYLNPNFKMLVSSECFHSICESCVDRIYATGSAPCPIPHCKKTLRKNKFHVRRFDDIAMEKEVDIRTYLSSIFNKRRENFASLDQYNDYLEQIEDLATGLVKDDEADTTKVKIEQIKKGIASLPRLRERAATAKSTTTGDTEGPNGLNPLPLAEEDMEYSIDCSGAADLWLQTSIAQQKVGGYSQYLDDVKRRALFEAMNCLYSETQAQFG